MSGRAGGGGRAVRRGAERDLRAARRRAAGDGGHARARVPHPPAPAAAGPRAGGGRRDLRRAVARGRQPHHGLDRGAAGADRPGRGLRDPVPGPLRRAACAPAPGTGADERARPGGGRGRGRRGRRPHDRHRRGRHRGRASSCCCSRRCRWCAASALLLVLGHRRRAGLRALSPASRRWCASRRGSAARSMPFAGAARRLAALAAHPRLEAARERMADRAWRALGVRPVPPAPGAGRRAGGGRGGTRAGHPERGGVRRAAARAPGPPGAARRERAAGRHRRVRRDRRDGARRRHHPARGARAG